MNSPAPHPPRAWEYRLPGSAAPRLMPAVFPLLIPRTMEIRSGDPFRFIYPTPAGQEEICGRAIHGLVFERLDTVPEWILCLASGSSDAAATRAHLRAYWEKHLRLESTKWLLLVIEKDPAP